MDKEYYRPAEVESLLGDSTKARNELGWSPSIDFKELVKEMTRHDLKNAKRSSFLKQNGFDISPNEV